MTILQKYKGLSEKVMNIKDSNELEFAIFCIENVTSFLGRDAGEVYELMREGSSDMHCMSKQYLSKDLSEEYERERRM